MSVNGVHGKEARKDLARQLRELAARIECEADTDIEWEWTGEHANRPTFSGERPGARGKALVSECFRLEIRHNPGF